MNSSILIQTPESDAKQLFLLFHGVGSTPQSLMSLGQVIGKTFPESMVVSIQAPDSSDLGQGFQWFSIRGVTEENRVSRVAEAMPAFIKSISYWQQRSKVDASSTALVGFSQGAIMALASTQSSELRAGRVFALAGRYPLTPDAVPTDCTVHLIHGKQDAVIPYGYAVHAAERLIALGCDVTADIVPFVGHEITAEIEQLVVQLLQTHIALRYLEGSNQ